MAIVNVSFGFSDLMIAAQQITPADGLQPPLTSVDGADASRRAIGAAD